MYKTSPGYTRVPPGFAVQCFTAGYEDLLGLLRTNPNLRCVPIRYLDSIREFTRELGYKTRIRYRGPHGRNRDTRRRDAYGFTVYFGQEQ